MLIKFKGIGDVILSTVVLKNIKAQYPEARIDFLTEKPSAPLLRGIPFIDEVIVFESGRKSEIFRKILLIRKRHYDLVIDMYSNPKSAQLTFASGARFRAGFPYRGRKYAYNLYGPPERGTYHAGELHLRFIEQIGIKVVSREPITTVPDEERLWGEKFFEALGVEGVFEAGYLSGAGDEQSAGAGSEAELDVGRFESSGTEGEQSAGADAGKGYSFVALVPGGGWESKRCDPEKFAEIGNEICKKYPVKCLILWGKGDLEEAEAIAALMKENAIMAPETTFLQMGGLALGCKFAVANDSGPMHFISSLGVPVLALHGPTDPKLQGPFGEKHETVRLDELDCIGCNLKICNRKHECFRDLPVERVMEKIDSLVRKNDIKFADERS
ncbi:MAG: glycosyltransferase family 9 protein [Ignavibacteriaceae bacterium]|nr:MAG: glycosyltransferase family 9 protein [Ignavibacteriaceae bacterium]